MGFKLIAHPFALLGSSLHAMKQALRELKAGRAPEGVPFDELKEAVGFGTDYGEEDRYGGTRGKTPG